MITSELKTSILNSIFKGESSIQESSDSNIDEYLDTVKSYDKIKRKDLEKKFEIPFEIPNYWRWVQLGDICGIYGGKRIPAGRKLTTIDTGHIYIRVSDMNDYTVETDNLLYVPEDIYPSIKNYIINKEDLYITVAGTIGKIGWIPEELDGANLTENANKIVFKNINKKWLYYLMTSPVVQNQINDMITKVGQPKLAIKRICNILIPIPCLEEQNRIVSKVDELFLELEDVSSLETELNQIKNSFPSDLRKSVLESAFSGKLVKTNLNQWDKNSESNIYKKLWEVTFWDKKFKEVDNSCQPKVIKYNYLLAAEMQKLNVGEGDVYLLSTGNYEGWTTEEKAGNYLATGEVVAIPWGGSPSVKYYKGKFVTSDNRIATSSDISILSNKYLYYYMMSKIPYLDTIYRGTSLRHPSMKAVLNMDIPIPSINEQNEIVSKIEELLPIIQEIENQV